MVHFLQDYLVIEEWPTGATEALSLDSVCGGSSPDYKIAYSQSGNLTQKDGEGVVLQVKPVAGTSDAPVSECIPFKTSKDLEWNYQLTSGDHLSAVFRFVHFNLQRDSDQGKLSILSNAGAVAEIRAPYGRKSFYKADSNLADSLTLDVGDTNVRESITLH